MILNTKWYQFRVEWIINNPLCLERNANTDLYTFDDGKSVIFGNETRWNVVKPSVKTYPRMDHTFKKGLYLAPFSNNILNIFRARSMIRKTNMESFIICYSSFCLPMQTSSQGVQIQRPVCNFASCPTYLSRFL